MKKFLLLSLLCFAFTTPGPDCEALHTGKFKIVEAQGDYIITRTKKHQTEEVVNTGLVAQFKIKWLSDCSYMLYDRQVIKGVDTMPSGIGLDTLYCNISDVKEFTHKVTCRFIGEEPMTCTLTKAD